MQEERQTMMEENVKAKMTLTEARYQIMDTSEKEQETEGRYTDETK